MITFTDEQALAIFDAVSDSETYSAQAIFSQVWESPYSWFQLTSNSELFENNPTVAELNEDSYTIASHKIITEDMIKIATITYYFSSVHEPVGSKWHCSIYAYLMDLDANDVDSILQVCMFGELRYS